MRRAAATVGAVLLAATLLPAGQVGAQDVYGGGEVHGQVNFAPPGLPVTGPCEPIVYEFDSTFLNGVLTDGQFAGLGFIETQVGGSSSCEVLDQGNDYLTGTSGTVGTTANPGRYGGENLLPAATGQPRNVEGTFVGSYLRQGSNVRVQLTATVCANNNAAPNLAAPCSGSQVASYGGVPVLLDISEFYPCNVLELLGSHITEACFTGEFHVGIAP